jgi:hypothetical protein
MWRLTEPDGALDVGDRLRLATSPTRTSPFLAKATTDGVVREPFGVRDDGGVATLEYGDDGVRRAEVDAYRSCHV